MEIAVSETSGVGTCGEGSKGAIEGPVWGKVLSFLAPFAFFVGGSVIGRGVGGDISVNQMSR